MFVIRSQITRDYYLRKLKNLFNHINLDLDKTMEEKRRDYGKSYLNCIKAIKLINYLFIYFLYFDPIIIYYIKLKYLRNQESIY